MHSLTAVFARIAASCATLASAVRDYTDLAKVRHQPVYQMRNSGQGSSNK